MKKFIFLFALIVSCSFISAMNKSEFFENLQLMLREQQVAACEGDDQHPGCVALRQFLESSCAAYRSTSTYYQGICNLADQVRSKSSLADHLHLVHKIPYSTAMQCENFLERIIDK